MANNIYDYDEETDTYQMLHPGTKQPIGERMSLDNMTKREEYINRNLAPRMEAGSKRSIKSRHEAKLAGVWDTFSQTEKMQDPGYAAEFQEYSTGVNPQGEVDYLQPIENFGRFGLNEFKDLGEGILNAFDAIDYAITGSDDALERTNERTQGRLQREEKFAVLDDAASGSEAGVIAPYLLSGQLEVPLGRGIFAAARKVQKGFDKTLIQGGADRAAINKIIDKIEGKPTGSITDINIKPGSIEKLERESLSRSKQITELDLDLGPAHEQIVGTSTIGAIEGTLHPDRTEGQGILENLSGHVLGKIPGRMGQRATNVRSEYEQQLIERAKSYGKKFLPGMETNSARRQTEEGVMRSNTSMMNSFERFDRENLAVDNREVSRVLGIENPNGLPITRDQMEGRLRELGKKFDELESVSSGRIMPAATRKINEMALALKEFPSIANTSAYASIAPYLKIFNNSRGRGMGEGQMARKRGYRFSGNEYKTTRASLNSEIDMAYKEGNKVKADALRVVRDELDNSVFEYKLETEGPMKAEAWERVREDYAIVQNIKQEGWDSTTGNVMLGDYHQFLSRTDPRYLQGEVSSNRFQSIYDLSRIKELEARQRKPGLGGSNVGGFTDRSDIDISARPYKGALNPIQRLKLEWYKRGYTTRGFGGSELPVQTSALGSAITQSSEPHEALFDAFDGTKNFINSSVETIKSIAESLGIGDDEEEATQDQSGAMR